MHIDLNSLLYLFLITFRMSLKKFEIRVLLRHYWKKGLNATSAAKEIRDVEGEDVVDAQMAQRWFKRFSDGNTSLEDQPRSGRPTAIDDEALRLAVEQEPSTSTRILSTEFGTSRSTINNHLNKLGFVNRRCRQVSHQLIPDQARDRIDICKRLLENPLDERQFKRIVACDEKWI